MILILKPNRNVDWRSESELLDIAERWISVGSGVFQTQSRIILIRLRVAMVKGELNELTLCCSPSFFGNDNGKLITFEKLPDDMSEYHVDEYGHVELPKGIFMTELNQCFELARAQYDKKNQEKRK